MKRAPIVLSGFAFLLLAALACAQDKVELMNGIAMKGKIAKVTDAEVTIQIGSAEKTFPIEKVHAITQDGERRVINEKEEGASSKAASKAEKKDEEKAEKKDEEKTGKKEEGEKEEASKEDKEEKKDAAKPGAKKKETKKHKVSPKKIESLVKAAGKDKPDWWEDVKVEAPSTLNLKEWAPPAGAKADAEKWPSTYIWEKIVPNPDRWKEAVKLTHQCLKEVETNAAEKSKVMLALAEYYRNLLNDYARAAYYYRQLDEGKGGNFAVEVGLGDCYAELGNEEMAMELYKKHEKTVGRDADIVRRYAKLGETKLAIKTGKAMIASSDGLNKAISLLATGDAARSEGDYKEALSLYEQVKDVSVPKRDTAERTEDEQKRVEQVKHRAEVAAKMIKLYDALDLKKIADGTYDGKAKGYAGDVEVSVTVKQGRIEEVKVTKHRETRFYTATTAIPERIVENQGLKVDAVTSATVSSDAIMAAAGAALESAMK